MDNLVVTETRSRDNRSCAVTADVSRTLLMELSVEGKDEQIVMPRTVRERECSERMRRMLESRALDFYSGKSE